MGQVGDNAVMRTFEQIGPELPRVARQSITYWLGRRQNLPLEAGQSAAAAVFVTLRHREGGSLRGCIGTLEPTEPDVVLETARNAVLAATVDPRFPAVSVDELAGLRVEVSVLRPSEPVADLAALDPRRYGVVVLDSNGRQGVLLPDLEGISDPATQVAIARQKAGIEPDSPVALRRFEVLKFAD